VTSDVKPALVHDYLLVLRGAERTFAALADLWPAAPIYTLLYDEEVVGDRFAGHEVTTSGLGKLPVAQDNFRALLPLLPSAASRLPVSGHDIVVSSSSAFAHGVRRDPDAVHVCYCHSPFRYVWHEYDRALTEVPRAARPVLKAILNRNRRWDLKAAANVTHFIANSQITQERIAEYYERDSVVIHPPIDTSRFSPGVPEDFFLYVGEILHHKRVELALKAARLAQVPIKVVGSGPELERLRREHRDHAEFLGRVDDHHLEALYARARAVIVPSVEEFGMVAVEAQASGRPVVAVNRGGACETVIDGETGVHVPVDDVEAMAEALRETDFDRFDVDAIVAQAKRFSADVFQEKMNDFVAQAAGPVYHQNGGTVFQPREAPPQPEVLCAARASRVDLRA
jgi:glycosyltransferase involved in cell wall biosynthesis